MIACVTCAMLASTQTLPESAVKTKVAAVFAVYNLSISRIPSFTLPNSAGTLTVLKDNFE